jgi:hypothetical protein
VEEKPTGRLEGGFEGFIGSFFSADTEQRIGLCILWLKGDERDVSMKVVVGAMRPGKTMVMKRG